MKNEDFERLKAVCEKEGFTIESYSGGKTAIIGVKDIWDGVEFAISIRNTEKYKSGIIYKIDEDLYHTIKAIEEVSNAFFKPSTESAYIEQLKKEAFDRFGEIKEGDRFKKPNSGYETISPLITNPQFLYYKSSDTFYFGGVEIYEQGKWATKVKERVQIKWLSTSCDTIKFDYSDVSHLNLVKLGPEMANVLEKYLNQEL